MKKLKVDDIKTALSEIFHNEMPAITCCIYMTKVSETGAVRSYSYTSCRSGAKRIKRT